MNISNKYPFYEKIFFENQLLPIKIYKFKSGSRLEKCVWHWHEAIEIYYVISGSIKLNSNSSIIELRKGDIGYIHWGHPHKDFAYTDKTTLLVFQIDLNSCPYLSRLPQLQLPNYLFDIYINNNKYLQNLLNNILKEYTDKKVGYELNIMASFYNFFTWILRNQSYSSNGKKEITNKSSINHIHRILHYLNKNYKNISSLSVMSKDLGLSKEYMCRIFKKETGQTIISHLNKQRIHYAASLILDGISLSEASTLSGFSDYNYFSKVFKKEFKCTPSKYLTKNEKNF